MIQLDIYACYVRLNKAYFLDFITLLRICRGHNRSFRGCTKEVLSSSVVKDVESLCVCSWVDVTRTQSLGALKCPQAKPHKTRRKNVLEKDFEKIFFAEHHNLMSSIGK